MGAVGSRVEAFVGDLRDTPWPESERLVAWANEAGDDVRAAWANAERADDVLALAAAYGVAVAPALAYVAALVREAASQLGLREARVVRVAFAAEQGGIKAPAGRIKLLDDAKALLVDAQKKVLLVAAHEAAKGFANHAEMEVLRAAGFLALGVVTAGDTAPAHANAAHALRQLAAAFAAKRLGASDPRPIASPEEFQGRVDAAAVEELSRLGPKLRVALGADFEQALAAPPV